MHFEDFKEYLLSTKLILCTPFETKYLYMFIIMYELCLFYIVDINCYIVILMLAGIWIANHHSRRSKRST